MSKVLVTGGAGFIGSHLALTMLKKGHGVSVMDNLSTGKMENLPCELREDDVIFITKRPIDKRAISRSLRRVDVVFHLAALPSVPRSVENPAASQESGTALTFALLDHARKAGVKRFVYASSSSVYGANVKLPQRENDAISPLSPYAATKAAGEAMCHAFAMCYAMDTASMRFFNVYGPRQSASSHYSGVIARFCKAIASGNGVEIHGNGKQSRDFTYVSDVVDALVLAGTSEQRLNGAAINVGCGKTHSVLDILAALERVSGYKPDRMFKERRPGDTQVSIACMNKALRLLGHEPVVSLEEGLRRTLSWYKEQRR